MPKLIGESCELVKLCHINHIGPGLLRHTVGSSYGYMGARRQGQEGHLFHPGKYKG